MRNQQLLALLREYPEALRELRKAAGYSSLRKAQAAAHEALADCPELQDVLPNVTTISFWERSRESGIHYHQPSYVSLRAYLAGLGYDIGDLERAALRRLLVGATLPEQESEKPN